MGRKPGSDYLAWIDLETTGLLAETAVIVEIACVMTDGNLTVRNIGPNLVIQQDIDWSTVDEFVAEMHKHSGLYDLIPYGVSLREAELACLEFFNNFAGAGVVPLAGSTVGFDRKFLAKYMPELEAWFHYRNADISSVQEFMTRWNLKLVEASPEPAEVHRALPDILESIEKARFYRSQLVPNAC